MENNISEEEKKWRKDEANKRGFDSWEEWEKYIDLQYKTLKDSLPVNPIKTGLTNYQIMRPIVQGVGILTLAIIIFAGGILYERIRVKKLNLKDVARTEKLNTFIQDTAADHEYNITKAQVKENNEHIDNITNPKLHEIKHNLGDAWNIRYNDSILNAWRQFENESK